MKKTVLIGIDGAPYTMLTSFVKHGIMPNFAALIQAGVFKQLMASIPDNSRAVYPPKLLKMAKTMGYRRDVDAGKVRKSKAGVTFSKFTLTKTP